MCDVNILTREIPYFSTLDASHLIHPFCLCLPDAGRDGNGNTDMVALQTEIPDILMESIMQS